VGHRELRGVGLVRVAHQAHVGEQARQHIEGERLAGVAERTLRVRVEVHEHGGGPGYHALTDRVHDVGHPVRRQQQLADGMRRVDAHRQPCPPPHHRHMGEVDQVAVRVAEQRLDAAQEKTTRGFSLRFSITNPGPYGGLYGLPIINQPNVAILSTGGIQRRPVVVTDELGRESIGIRDMIYLALSFDHRLVDGATADMFMAHLKAVLEKADFEL
jgi:hypothetical protein